MSKKIKLFEGDEFCFKKKFYLLMDLLISNQSDSRFESFLLFGIFYLQIISSFFAEEIGIFFPKKYKSDNVLYFINKLLRVKDLFIDYYDYFRLFQIILFILIIVLIFHFILSILTITKTSFYSYNKKIINYYIKIFLYVGYNITFDICFTSLCLGSNELNPNFSIINCSNQSSLLIIISFLFIIISLFLYIFLNIYFNDSFYLSNSYYAKMSCYYDVFMGINCMIISLLVTQIKTFSKEIFLIYNCLLSVILLIYYIKHYLYYDKYINIFTGIFHLLYMWTSIYSLVFSYLDFKEKGIIYISSSIIICFFYSNINNRIEAEIFLKKPFYKINNKFYILYYFRNLFDLINNVEESYQDKSILSGIIKMHLIECPNPNCLIKTKEDIYLPLTNKWNDRNKKENEDEVFLKNFIIIVMNYFLYMETCSADMFLNLSLYYLKVIGNYCQAIYYYKKATEIKLNLREEFSLIRLSIQISHTLSEKLKPSNEQCTELENLDISMYYKYEELSHNFLDEINNDVNLSLEFWKAFKVPYKEENKRIDFNKVFDLTDKIGITKKNVENLWNKLLKIYNGVNDFFELYLEYIEQINDDDLKKRDLETLKRKADNYSDHLNNNYYSVLFNKETGIIIVNGDRGNEGVIELSNKEIENIFKYKSLDLKGMNLSFLMPKVFAKDHSKYIERYFSIGQKKLIDKSDFNTFGKDKDNSIIKIKLAIKLFPILNDNVFFVGLILKENIDDIIFLDDKFNIQGMSLKLMKILNINNKYLFQENEIPFYVICTKFVNFYNIFLHGKKKGDIIEKLTVLNIDEEDDSKEKDEENKKEENIEIKDAEKEEIHENIEINENVELEYEIKLPQFLIDYSEKSNKNELNSMRLMTIKTESEEITEIIEEFDEDDLLMDEERNKEKDLKQLKNSNSKNIINISTVTPTPTPEFDNTITPANPQGSESIEEESDVNNGEQNVVFNKETEKEKIYKEKMNQYKSLFNSGKINELEELIDICNKNSSSVEYKFNFTFDKYKYANKQISYIVRCIDNKNDEGKSQEESLGDLDPKAAKYKKEKAEAIKPLFELLEEERREIIKLPEIFLNLSLENKKFQKLLQSCKNDINVMSKTHGQKKDEVIEDENSSQTSQAGFDTGLVKKNKIEEIRSNLMNDISNFYTLKYIKILIYLIGFSSIFFSGFYYLNFSSLYKNLLDSSFININLYQSALWTSELISIFVTLRVLYLKEIINKYGSKQFDYYDFYTNNKNISQFYDYCVSTSIELYDKLSVSYGVLEMEISNYLNGDELKNLYWDKVNITYMIDDNYDLFKHGKDSEYFPMAVAQILSNSFSYLNSPIFNSIVNNISFFNNTESNRISFDYMTFLIIENGNNNILPNLIKKLKIIPVFLTKFNLNQIKKINYIVIFYFVVILIFGSLYFILFHLTNKSMIDGMNKVSKIKLEKIEEILKRIKLFSINLKKFRDKDMKTEDNKDTSELFDDDSKIKSGIKSSTNNERIKKSIDQENSSGFNIDYKKYIHLNILKYSFLYPAFIFLYILICLVPVYIFTRQMIDNTNHLLIVQNYIFSHLLIATSSTIEIKCFISECKNTTKLDSNSLFNYDIIQDILRGLNLFPKVSHFYNEKFLLNACAAVINKEKNLEEYNNCLNDITIKSANNTENLLKLMNDLYLNLKKESEINEKKNHSYYKQNLFSDPSYGEIEKIFFKYVMPIEANFVEYISDDLNEFLSKNKIIVIIIILIMGTMGIIICVLSRLFLINKLIHNLRVSRCIIKIIPTSVIINTQELETWIENKY